MRKLIIYFPSFSSPSNAVTFRLFFLDYYFIYVTGEISAVGVSKEEEFAQNGSQQKKSAGKSFFIGLYFVSLCALHRRRFQYLMLFAQFKTIAGRLWSALPSPMRSIFQSSARSQATADRCQLSRGDCFQAACSMTFCKKYQFIAN